MAEENKNIDENWKEAYRKWQEAYKNWLKKDKMAFHDRYCGCKEWNGKELVFNKKL